MKLPHPLVWINLLGGLFLTSLPAQPAVTAEQLNAVFGIPLWQDSGLWEESDETVASRLGWQLESRTSVDSSFREYPSPQAKILECRPFSLALYGEQGKVASLSMVFANKGDVAQLIASQEPPESRSAARRQVARMFSDYHQFIRADAEKITEKLTALLGPPKADKFGQGRGTSESVKRWDWRDHAILLAAPRDEYAAVRIVPVAVADGSAPSTRLKDAELRELLARRVEKRSNGDVVLQDIPMVNQGPRGYCVPATWERVLRYLGIPADMYILAMAGNTGVGGGTTTVAIANGAADLVRRAGRRIERSGGPLKIHNVAKSIDRGLPIMWSMNVVDDLNFEISRRTQERSTVTDWEKWRKDLEPIRKNARKIRKNPEGSHVCMIIGYNLETKEIATSDSWGPQFQERWMTIEEAEAISNNDYSVIVP